MAKYKEEKKQEMNTQISQIISTLSNMKQQCYEQPLSHIVADVSLEAHDILVDELLVVSILAPD